MKRILITGAAGAAAALLRPFLAKHYQLVLTDLLAPSDLTADETFIQADLVSLACIQKAMEGVEGIVHLGGQSVEAPWEKILSANIEGTYNVFEAARRIGISRVVF